MAQLDWYWTFFDDQRHHVPDKKLRKADVRHGFIRLEPLRGSAHTLGAWDERAERFVGWILTEDLGHHDVKAWIAATGWRQLAGPRGGKFRGHISEGPRFAVEARERGAWARKGEYRTRELAVAAARGGCGDDARVRDPAGAVVWPAGGGKGRRAPKSGARVGDLTVNELRWLLRPILAWMGQNLHQWTVVDTLKDFTTWGFWQQAGGQAYAIIDADIARRVLAKLREFVREAPDRDVIEVWDRLAHYEAHARGGGKRRAAAYAVVDPSTGRRQWRGRQQKPTRATGRRLDALVRQLTQMTKG